MAKNPKKPVARPVDNGSNIVLPADPTLTDPVYIPTSFADQVEILLSYTQNSTDGRLLMTISVIAENTTIGGVVPTTGIEFYRTIEDGGSLVETALGFQTDVDTAVKRFRVGSFDQTYIIDTVDVKTIALRFSESFGVYSPETPGVVSVRYIARLE